MANLNDPSLSTVGAHRAAAYTGMQEDYWSAFDDALDDPRQSPAPTILARKGGKRIKGRKTVALMKTARPQSATAAGEGYLAVPPGTTVRINPEITPKKMLAQLGSTLEVRADARAGQSSWISAVEDDMKGLEESIISKYVHNIYFGRLNILGRVSAVAAVTLASGSTPAYNRIMLYPRSGALNTTATFWDQGLMGTTYGLANGVSVAFVSTTAGATAPINNAATAIGDPADANSFISTRRASIIAVSNADPANPTIDVTSAATLAGVVAAGDWIIEYNSRRAGIDADPEDAIYDMHSMEGVGSAFTRSGIVAAHLGLLKASHAGMTPIHTGQTGVAVQWTDAFAKYILRTAMRECGRSPTNLICTYAQMDEVEKEYQNLRRLEPVLGKVGADYTTMGIVAHGKLLKYTPDHMALPNAMIQTDPSFSEYLENTPLGPAVAGYERRAVDSSDQERIVLARRGNILFSNPMGLGLRSELIEAEYTAP